MRAVVTRSPRARRGREDQVSLSAGRRTCLSGKTACVTACRIASVVVACAAAVAGAAGVPPWRAPRPAGSPPRVVVIAPARLWPELRALSADSLVAASGAAWMWREADSTALGDLHVLDQPTFVVLDATGGEVDRIVGAVPRAEFRAEWQRILAGRETVAALLAQAARRPDDAAFHAALGGKLADRGDPRARALLQQALRGRVAPRDGVARAAWEGFVTVARHERDDASLLAALDSLAAAGEDLAADEQRTALLARACLHRGDSTRALAAWSRALAAAPDDAGRRAHAIAMCRLWRVGADSLRVWEERAATRGGR